MAKLYAGWGMNGRPFSPTEFKNSYIKKNLKRNKRESGFTYKEYLRLYAKEEIWKQDW